MLYSEEVRVEVGWLDDNEATTGVEVGEGSVSVVRGDPVGVSQAVRQENHRELVRGQVGREGDSHYEVDVARWRGKGDRADSLNRRWRRHGDGERRVAFGVVVREGRHVELWSRKPEEVRVKVDLC